MPTVQTVTGPVSTADLGITLVHEHLLIDMYEVSLNAAGVLLDERAASEELSLFRDAGGVTVVTRPPWVSIPTGRVFAGFPRHGGAGHRGHRGVLASVQAGMGWNP